MKALFELSAVLMPGASLTLFADLGACRVQKSSVTICVLPAPSGWRATSFGVKRNIVEVRFLSTPSGWRATRGLRGQLLAGDDFYPRPPGGGRHDIIVAFHPPKGISIHALRVEGDWGAAGLVGCALISIHALRVEGDLRRSSVILQHRGFLSTPSGWRATLPPATVISGSCYFYPRPPGCLLYTSDAADEL